MLFVWRIYHKGFGSMMISTVWNPTSLGLSFIMKNKPWRCLYILTEQCLDFNHAPFLNVFNNCWHTLICLFYSLLRHVILSIYLKWTFVLSFECGKISERFTGKLHLGVALQYCQLLWGTFILISLIMNHERFIPFVFSL